MSCRRCDFPLFLFVCAAVALQIFTSSQNAIFVGGTTTANDLRTTDAPASIGAVLSRSSQDNKASKNVLDKLYQDGMLFGTNRTSSYKRDGVRRRARKSIRDVDRLWPQAEVPYIVERPMRTGDEELLNQSFAAFHLYTCIRFRPKQPGDQDYVRIVDGQGCHSFVGRLGGMQELIFHKFCLKKRIIIHELGFVIGFVLQHKRPDRDDYVTIRFENVRSDFFSDFYKSSADTVNFYGIPYDYLSIMHCGQHYGSSNLRITIETKNSSYQTLIGGSTGLSFRDAKLANMMYRCAELNGCKNITCPGEGFVGQDCRCWCPSENSNKTAEHCEEDARCTNTSCPGEALLGHDCQCWCPSGTINYSNEHGAAVVGCTNTTCPGEGLAGQNCRCWCPPGNSNNTYEHGAGKQANVQWSIGNLAVIAVGCAVSLAAILTVFIFVVHHRRQLRQKNSPPRIPAAENEAVQSSAVTTEYCSLDHQSTDDNYAALRTEEPMYDSLQPNTAEATYCELEL